MGGRGSRITQKKKSKRFQLATKKHFNLLDMGGNFTRVSGTRNGLSYTHKRNDKTGVDR
jgi:hypothetical protein